jgi:hypothetical protein
MRLQKSFGCTGIVLIDHALTGITPGALAAVAVIPAIGPSSTHILMEREGNESCIFARNGAIVHATMRSPIVVVHGQRGHYRWTGAHALLALAVTCNRPAEVEIISTSSAISGHAPNLDWPVEIALIEMAVAADECLVATSFPHIFEPIAISLPELEDSDALRCAPTKRCRVA